MFCSIISGGNPSIAVLWADRSEGPYNFLHAGFGLGALLGPLISNPFMSDFVIRQAALNITASSNSSSSNPLYVTGHGSHVTSDLSGVLGWNVSHQLGYSTSPGTVPWGSEPTLAGRSRIEYPYAIVGICCAAVSCVFFVYFLIDIPAPFVLKSAKWKDIANPRTCAG